MDRQVKIRFAGVSDIEIILKFIKELARYEELEHLVTATSKNIEETFFRDNPHVYALIIEEANAAVGFAVYFFNYSTFLCRHGIYIEDIYIKEQFRGKGYGKLLFKFICNEAKKNNCGRVEWWCLDSNKPSVDFYLSIGAEAMSDWTVYRLNEKQISEMAL